jgi:predicted O-methyltransferase YrrM
MTARKPDYPHSDVPQWAAVDTYFAGLLAPLDGALSQALVANARAGMPAHEVSATQGKFLELLVKLTRAKDVLEIGTLGGFSTIWMARALPTNGRIVTIERNVEYAQVALQNLRVAGIAQKVDLRVGVAIDVLPSLQGPFDFIFVDADKPNNPAYLEWALKLSRPGTVIIADNVVRGGSVVNAASADPSVLGVRRFLGMMAATDRLDSTALQTVGEKGWDGFSISIVKA